MRALNGAAFWIGALALAGLAVWFALDPVRYLLTSGGRLDWRGVSNIAPLAAATLAVMFILPTAARLAQEGKWRKAWTLLTVACALALGLAYPGRWLVWTLSADF